MRKLQMLDTLKRIGAGIILSLFVASSYEDSFAFSFEHFESSNQGTISSDETVTDNASGRDYSYDGACGKQHSGHLPCGSDCQFSECRDAIVPWKGPTSKKHSVKSSFVGTVPPFRPSAPELARSPYSCYPSSEVPDKNSYVSLVGIIKNLN